MSEKQTIAQLFDLAGKSAIVTGGGMGIGQAIAYRLTEAGAAVMIADINMDAAQRTVDEIESRGGRARAVEADARSAADAKSVVEATVDSFGSVDILVNNAGIYPIMPFMEIKEELWDRTLDINLKGVYIYSQAAARRMIEQGNGGKIVNIASTSGLLPSRDDSHYSASKGGVIMLTKGMALELSRHGILVNVVAPGSIYTPGIKTCGDDLIAAGLEDEIKELGYDKKRYPLGRLGTADDIARVVLFAASAASDYMTGSLLLVDGGLTIS